MKGLLHRLAARATGTSVAVRSDARLAIPGAIVPSVGEGDAPSFEFERRPPAAGSPTLPPLVDEAHDPAGPVTNRSTPSHPEPRQAAAWPEAGIPGQHHQATPDAPPLDLPVTPGPRLIDVRVDDNERGPARTELAIDVAQRSADRRVQEVEVERRDMDVRIIREPPALVPPAAAVDRARPAAAVGALGRIRGAGPDRGDRSDGDVHVHIGCVEVTAVHEPAAPRRRPSPSPPPMSLDAYFAKRGRT